MPQPASRTGNEISCLMMQLLQTQPEMLPKHSGKEKRKKVSNFMRAYISIIEKISVYVYIIEIHIITLISGGAGLPLTPSDLIQPADQSCRS